MTYSNLESNESTFVLLIMITHIHNKQESNLHSLPKGWCNFDIIFLVQLTIDLLCY
jgi:hypothetical protein